jgi:glutathione S-transferase
VIEFGAMARAYERAERILDADVRTSGFGVGDRPTVADFSMIAYLSFPKDETWYDFAISHPSANASLGRLANLPGWQPPYDLLRGKRLVRYA